MDIPSPFAGKITEVNVMVGDKVSQGSKLGSIEASGSAEAEKPAAKPDEAPAAAPTTDADMQTEVLVLGAGPGGYTAAFRASDLGKRALP